MTEIGPKLDLHRVTALCELDRWVLELDEESGAVVQICDVPGEALTADTFEVLPGNFVRTLAAWMDVIAAEPADETAAPAGGDAIRV